MSFNTEQMFKPLYMRHDLMIELGRLEKVIEDTRMSPSAMDIEQLAPLQTRRARISEILDHMEQ